MRRPTVLFLCRGSVDVGLGHVFRSRAVARQMSRSARVRFVLIGEDYTASLIAPLGLEADVVAADEEALAIFDRVKPDICVFDMMHFSAEGFARISESCLTVSLSSIFTEFANVDVVFHRTIEPSPDWPRSENGPQIRAGLRYTVIGHHCRRISERTYRRTLSNDPLAVAVSMGGSDASNKALAAVHVLKKVDRRLLIWVLLGEGYGHSYQELVDAMSGSRHEIILAKTSDSMWRVLETCALAVLAGGTTTYEAAYAGLPSLNSLDTGKHRFLLDELVARGACLGLGESFEASLASLRRVVTRLSDDREELLSMHQRSKGLIDQRGTNRIASEILRMIPTRDKPRRRGAARG